MRHGETESNIKRRYQGWTESPLSKKGLKQAEKTGQWLAEKKIDALYASDLSRASHTAQIIGASFLLKPVISPLLREINFGRWEGLTYDDIMGAWPSEITSWLDDPFLRSAPGGETVAEVGQRMLSFVEELLGRYPGDQGIVVVSHGGSIRALISHVMGLDKESFWQLGVDNASVSRISFSAAGSEVVYLNHTAHLAVL